jgi:DNA-binding transcriptional LysR family regulator
VSPEDLDLKKLKAFQLVARHGSLRVAAARLRVTVPAVSFQIKRLEEELDTGLFQRTSGGLVLTDAGERFVDEVDGLFERVEKALSSLPAKAPPTQQLSIATSSDVVWFSLPRISNFITRYPNVRLHYRIYHSTEIVARMMRGDLDVGIGYFTNPPRSLQKEVVAKTGLTLACAPGHPLLRRRPVRLEDIARHRLVVLPHQSATRKMLDHVFAEAGIKLNDIMEAGNCQTAREFVERGVGAAIVHSICMDHQRSSRLRYIDISGLFSKMEFSLVYRKTAAANPSLQHFLEAITSEALN